MEVADDLGVSSGHLGERAVREGDGGPVALSLPVSFLVIPLTRYDAIVGMSFVRRYSVQICGGDSRISVRTPGGATAWIPEVPRSTREHRQCAAVARANALDNAAVEG